MKNDGGPAFPATKYVEPSPHTTGMTLRDYFAAAVLQGMYGKHPIDDFEGYAKAAYGIADAMLAERENDNDRPDELV